MTKPGDSRDALLSKKKKLLLVGSNHQAAIEHHYMRYLSEEGVPHDLFAAQGIFFDYYNASILNKISFKLGLSGIYKKINEELLLKIAQMKPDLVLVFKGMEIFVDTLRIIKEGGAKLINYNPDNPFLFSGKGSGNQNIYDSIPYFDLHITYDRDIQDKLERLGLKVARIPFGYELTDEEIAICAAEPEVSRICFLGNPDTNRIEFLNPLAETGLAIDVYGHNWNRHKLHSGITRYDAVYGLEFWKVLRKYRVQLNLMRPHNLNSHNMRSFEVPGIGGIGLFPDTPDHRDNFTEGEELFLYSDVDDCSKKAIKLLDLPKERAMTIRNNALSRCRRSGYSYKHRTRQLLEEMQRLL